MIRITCTVKLHILAQYYFLTQSEPTQMLYQFAVMRLWCLRVSSHDLLTEKKKHYKMNKQYMLSIVCYMNVEEIFF